MSAPLARAAFDCSLDDMVDVAWRYARHSPAMRRTHWRQVCNGMILVAVLLPLLFHLLDPELPGTSVVIGTTSGVVAVALLTRLLYPIRYRRIVRRILGEALPPGPLRCEVELGPDSLRVTQPHRTAEFPWSDVDAAYEDAGDLVFLARAGVAVVRQRAFASADERRAFLARARELAVAARGRTDASAPAD